MAAQRHKPDHHDGQRSVNIGGSHKADGIGDDRGQGDADNHGNELEHLAHGIGLSPGGFRGKQLREESTVVYINERIQGTCQHVHNQHIGKGGTRSQESGRIEKQDKTQHQQRRADQQPGTAAAPLGPGAVRQEAIHRIVNGIQEGVQEQDQGVLGRGDEAQPVHVKERGIGLEHVHRDGCSEHSHCIAQGAGRFHRIGFQFFHWNAPFSLPRGGIWATLTV